jgi:hypothetical protein
MARESLVASVGLALALVTPITLGGNITPRCQVGRCCRAEFFGVVGVVDVG